MAWEAEVLPGSPMSRLFEKIKRCKFALADWGHNTFGSTKTQLQEKQKLLEQLCLLNSATCVGSIKDLKANISNLIHQEELFLWQRSHSIWRDKNTKYFHNRTSQCQCKNHISRIFNNEGRWCTSDVRISQVAEAYFQDLFSSTQPDNIECLKLSWKLCHATNEWMPYPKVHLRKVRTTLF